jgi:hypothetical protein
VRRKPYSVVLLDEVEKAHQNVLNILLQVFRKCFRFCAILDQIFGVNLMLLARNVIDINVSEEIKYRFWMMDG